MLLAVRKPDPGPVAGGEYGNAGGLDGSGKMHGTAVMSDEEPGPREDGSALTWGKVAAEVDDRAGGRRGLTPAVGGELTGFVLMGRTGENERVIRIANGEFGEQGPPILATPVFGLHFRAYTDGNDGVF